MADVLVTVGMGPWPFDRLLRAIGPLCSEHRVVAQTGASTVRPPCHHVPVMPYSELRARIAAADLVITHAGNTVRLVQRAGKVPIAVARRAALGEMGNDHQCEYLRSEEREGRVVAVWDLADLQGAVAAHPRTEERILRQRPLPPPADPAGLAAILDATCARLVR